MCARVRFTMLSVVVSLALLPAAPAKAQSPSITIAWATYTYYDGWFSDDPGDMAAYGGFYVAHGWQLGQHFFFEAHVYPGVAPPDADGWSAIPAPGGWTCTRQYQYPTMDYWYFTINAPASIVATNYDPVRQGWFASVRARLYNWSGPGGTKVILASHEREDQGTNGW